jgi:hypothetical protein
MALVVLVVMALVVVVVMALVVVVVMELVSEPDDDAVLNVANVLAD